MRGGITASQYSQLADSVMPTALCPDSVMPSQRYALPRLEGVCPKEQLVPEIEAQVDFTITIVFDQNTMINIQEEI